MFDACFAVFVQWAHMLPSCSQATWILSFLVVLIMLFCFKLLLHWTGMDWFEFPTQWKLYKCVHAQISGAWACLMHALQCLCNGHTCCPVFPMHHATCKLLFLRFHQCCHVVVSTWLLHWTGTCWFECSTKWKLCKHWCMGMFDTHFAVFV